MLSFLINFFKHRQQYKVFQFVVSNLLNIDVSIWLSYTTFSTGESKIPLKIVDIRFDKNTLLYEASLIAPFSNEVFSFLFKVEIDHHSSPNISIIDLADKSNLTSLLTSESTRMKGTFLYYGVKEEVVKSLRLYTTSIQEQSSSNHASNSNITFDNDPIFYSEHQLLDFYVTTDLLNNPNNDCYSKHPSNHSNSCYFGYSRSCGISSNKNNFFPNCD